MTGPEAMTAERFRAAIAAVRQIHERAPYSPDFDPYCGSCGPDDGWPCPTVAALSASVEAGGPEPAQDVAPRRPDHASLVAIARLVSREWATARARQGGVGGGLNVALDALDELLDDAGSAAPTTEAGATEPAPRHRTEAWDSAGGFYGWSCSCGGGAKVYTSRVDAQRAGELHAAEAGATAQPDTVFGVAIDVTLAEGKSLWIRTPEGVVNISALVGTQVAVYDGPDNPVGIVQLRRPALARRSGTTDETGPLA